MVAGWECQRGCLVWLSLASRAVGCPTSTSTTSGELLGVAGHAVAGNGYRLVCCSSLCAYDQPVDVCRLLSHLLQTLLVPLLLCLILNQMCLLTVVLLSFFLFSTTPTTHNNTHHTSHLAPQPLIPGTGRWLRPSPSTGRCCSPHCPQTCATDRTWQHSQQETLTRRSTTRRCLRGSSGLTGS